MARRPTYLGGPRPKTVKPNDRSIFMYMAPPKHLAEEVKRAFAQCTYCRMRVPQQYMEGKDGDFKKGCDLCVVLGSHEAINGIIGSCGSFAMWGTPKGLPEDAIVRTHAEEMAKGIGGNTTKEMVGYVERLVRCENCYFARKDATSCYWFHELTERVPKFFNDDGPIEEYACCNSQTEKE